MISIRLGLPIASYTSTIYPLIPAVYFPLYCSILILISMRARSSVSRMFSTQERNEI